MFRKFPELLEGYPPSIILFCDLARRKSQSRPGPASRLLQTRPCSPASFPTIAARDRHGIPFETDRALHGVEQSISGMLPLLRRSAESPSDPRSTTAAMREAIPFLCAAFPA